MSDEVVEPRTMWLVLAVLPWEGMTIRLPHADVPVSGPHNTSHFAPVYSSEEEARRHFPRAEIICVELTGRRAT